MTEQKAYIIASSHFLSESFPIGLLNKDESEVTDFIRENKWEPLERWEPHEIWELIEDLATEFILISKQNY